MKFKIISMVVALAILAIWIYFSGPEKILENILRADYRFLLLGITMSTGLVALRIYRWQFLLKRSGINLGFFDVAPSFMSGLLISNLTPGKIGEPARNLFLSRAKGIPISESISTVILERAVDIISIMVFSILGILTYGIFIAKSGATIAAVVSIYIAGIVAVFFLASSQNRMNKIFSIFPFNRIIKEPQKAAESISKSFNSLKDWKLVLPLLGTSLLVWFVEAIILYLAFSSLGADVPFMFLLSAFCIAILASILSSLPGGIGSMEVILTFFITSVVLIPISTISSAILLERIMALWYNLLLGAISFKFLK